MENKHQGIIEEHLSIDETFIQNTTRSFDKAILVDIDSTILDIDPLMVASLDAEFGISLPENHEYNLLKYYKCTIEELISGLVRSNYMDDSLPYAKTLEFINYYKELGYGIVLSTSRTFSQCCIDRTIANLERNGIYYDELHLTRNVKWKNKPFNKDVVYELYFDDAPYHIENFLLGKDVGDPNCPELLFVNKFYYNAKFFAENLPCIKELNLYENGWLPKR